MRKRPTKPRNRSRYAAHYAFSVQWLISYSDRYDHPVCCAAFTALRDAEDFAAYLKSRPQYYGVEIEPI